MFQIGRRCSNFYTSRKSMKKTTENLDVARSYTSLHSLKGKPGFTKKQTASSVQHLL